MAEQNTDVTAAAVQTTPEEEVRVCLFLMEGDYYAVTVDVLAEILSPQKIFPVPTTPQHVRGVINLRGNIIPIVDIRQALSLPAGGGAGQIAIIHFQQTTIGIVVDAVAEVLSVPKSGVVPLPPEIAAQDPAARTRSRYLQAVIQLENKVAALLDPDRLFDAIKLT